MSNAVFDASAVLALLQREPGSDAAMRLITDAWVSAVNLAEVLTKLQDAGMSGPDAAAACNELPIAVRSFDAAQAQLAATLRPATRHAGLSLGDRACLALARLESAPAVTADRSWVDLDIGVQVVLIRD